MTQYDRSNYTSPSSRPFAFLGTLNRRGPSTRPPSAAADLTRSLFPSPRSRVTPWFLIIVMALLLILAMSRFHFLQDSNTLDTFWDFGCVGIAILGVLLRARTIGRPPPADRNASAFYQVARHPLYAVNFLIFFAILLMVRQWWLLILGSLLYHHAITRRTVSDEMFLLGGNSRRDASPASNGDNHRARSLSWFASVRSEVPALLFVIIAFTTIEIAGHAVVERRFEFEFVWRVFFFGGLISCAMLRYFTKTGSSAQRLA